MNIKDKYKNELNDKMLSSEFKQDLAELMRTKFESQAADEPEESAVVSDEEVVFTPQIIHKDRSRFSVLRYIAASAAVFAAVFSSVFLIRSNFPDQTISQDPVHTTVKYIQTLPESSTTGQNDNLVLEVTTAAVSSEKVKVTEYVAASSTAHSSVPVTSNYKHLPERSSETAAPETKPAETTSDKPAVTTSEQKPETTAVTSVSETLPETTAENTVTEAEHVQDSYVAFAVDRTVKRNDGLYDVYLCCTPDSNAEVLSAIFRLEYDTDNLILEDCQPVYNDYELLVTENGVLFSSVDCANVDLSGHELARYTFRMKDNAPKGEYIINVFTDVGYGATKADGDEFKIVDVKCYPGYITYE